MTETSLILFKHEWGFIAQITGKSNSRAYFRTLEFMCLSVSLSHCLFPSEFIILEGIVLITLCFAAGTFHQDGKNCRNISFLFIIPEKERSFLSFSMSLKIWFDWFGHMLFTPKKICFLMVWKRAIYYVAFCEILCLYLKYEIIVRECNYCIYSNNWKDSKMTP